LRSIARRVKLDMTLSTSRQNGHPEAIFVFDCYYRRTGLLTTRTTSANVYEVSAMDEISTKDTEETATSGRERPTAPATKKWMADVTTALATTLTAADRCDRCGAQAYVRARLSSGGELLFCAHHGREHLPKLQSLTTNIQDETHRLRPDPVGVGAR